MKFKYLRPVYSAPLNDPFNSAPTNIFDQAAERQRQSSATPMPEGFQQEPPQPSRAVPGHTVTGGGGPMPEPKGEQMKEGSSPLDKYARIAQTDIVKAEEPKQRQPDITDALDSLSFDDVHKSYSSQNLLANLDKEQVKKALQEGDADAFMDILQTVARTSAAAATVGSTRLTNSGMKAHMDRMRTEIPDHLKKTQIANLWQGNGDAVLNKPEVAPLRAAATDMFTKQYPQATPEQIRTMTVEYFKDFFAAGYQSTQEAEASQKAKTSGDQKSTMTEFFKDLM